MDIILYLSNGYPTLDASLQMAKEYADAGCGIIEIDFPSHDPYLESKLIAGRMAILAEGDAQNRDDIIYLEKLPVFHADGTIKE